MGSPTSREESDRMKIEKEQLRLELNLEDPKIWKAVAGCEGVVFGRNIWDAFCSLAEVQIDSDSVDHFLDRFY